MRTLGCIPTWDTLGFIGSGNLWQVMCSRSLTTSHGLCWPWKRGQKAEAGAFTWVPGGGAGSHPSPSWLQPCCCSQGAVGCLTTSFLPTRAQMPFLGRCFSFSPFPAVWDYCIPWACGCHCWLHDMLIPCQPILHHLVLLQLCNGHTTPRVQRAPSLWLFSIAVSSKELC